MNQYNGVEVLVYDKNGIKYEMAQNIVGALGELGFREIGVQARPGLVVLRKTKMPALLIETGFLNSDKDNQLYDEKNAEIAQAIAGAILGTLDQQQGKNLCIIRCTDWSFSQTGKCGSNALLASGKRLSGIYFAGWRTL